MEPLNEKKMMKIKGWFSTNVVGSETKFEIELDDNLPPEEIEEEVWNYICERIDYNWEIEEK